MNDSHPNAPKDLPASVPTGLQPIADSRPRFWRLLAKISRQGWELVQLKARIVQLEQELALYHKVIKSAQNFREAAEEAARATQELKTHMARATAVELGDDFKVGHSRRLPDAETDS
jgi:hypothetical protein